MSRRRRISVISELPRANVRAPSRHDIDSTRASALVQHHGSVHRPSLGGGPMTTTNTNNNTAAAAMPTMLNLADVHTLSARSSSSFIRALASASGARLSNEPRVSRLVSPFPSFARVSSPRSFAHLIPLSFLSTYSFGIFASVPMKSRLNAFHAPSQSVPLASASPAPASPLDAFFPFAAHGRRPPSRRPFVLLTVLILVVVASRRNARVEHSFRSRSS